MHQGSNLRNRRPVRISWRVHDSNRIASRRSGNEVREDYLLVRAGIQFFVVCGCPIPRFCPYDEKGNPSGSAGRDCVLEQIVHLIGVAACELDVNGNDGNRYRIQPGNFGEFDSVFLGGNQQVCAGYTGFA